MASGIFKSSTTSNGKYMSIEWSSTANASTRTSTFTAKMVFHGSIQGNALEGSNFTVNGTRYSIEGWWDSYASGNPLTFKEVTITINHDSNGNASVPVSAYILYNSASWSDLSASGTAVLDNIGSSVTKPTVAPSVLTITGAYKNHGTTALIFSGVAGATQYKIYHKRLNIDKTETQWYYTTTVSGSPVSISHGYCGLAIKFGISGINSAGEGPMKESEWIYHRGARFYNNSNFNNYCYIKRWNGSKWEHCLTRIYDGSEWTNT